MTVQLAKASFARTAWLVVFAMSLVLAMAAAPPAGAQEGESPSDEPAFVHPDLQQQVADADASDGSVLAVAVVEGSGDISDAAGDPRAVAAELQDFAQTAQAGVVDQIASVDTGAVRVVNQLWILNALVVEISPTADALNELASVAGVERIVPNYEFSVIEPEEAEPATVEDRTYGIDVIEAHQVWEELGIEGEGVRVATLDTGVDIDHPDLEGKMLTDDPDDLTYPGGWMEFGAAGSLVSSEPHDSSDHGTHVAGTIHGEDYHQDGIHIGVAPESDMMHGLVIPGGQGDFGQVAAGMQWAMDPTDADGDPAGEPADVVNMSLGAPDYIPEMIEPTQNMVDAGIFPSFAIGNEDLFGNCGPGRTIGSGSPGNVYEAIGIGATDQDDDVAGFSCGEVIDTFDPGYWGDDAPEEWPDEYVKPDLSAPGVAILSTLPDGDYGAYSGTSMAAPHVAGTAALMLSAAPGESVDSMHEILEDTSFFDDRHGEERPNTRFGYGRINAFGAVEELATASGVEGTVSGPDGPIEDATITAGDRTATTDEDGAYQLRLEPGEHDVTAEAFGFDTETVNITVSEEEFANQDFNLDATPTGSIEGQVTDADSGAGIEGAQVSVDDAPFATETDGDGNYAISDVPEGEWTVNATAGGYEDAEPQPVTVAEGESATVDLALQPLPPAIGIAGDFDGTIGAFLEAHNVPNESYEWEDDVTDYPLIIVNRPGDPGEDVFINFINGTEENGTGVLFLDTWSSSGNGIELSHLHLDNPQVRETDFAGSIDELSYAVTESHPIVGSLEAGDTIPHDFTTQWKDHAWFDDYTGDDVTLIADVAADGQILGRGIAAAENENNRHALLSMHGASSYVDPNDWEDGSVDVFLNAIEWAQGEDAEISVDPESLSATVAEGASSEETLTISSAGEDTLDWEIATGEVESDGAGVTREAGVTRADAGTVDPDNVEPAPQRVESSDVKVHEDSFTEGFDDIETLPDDGWDMINNSDPVGSMGWLQGEPDVFESHVGDPDSYIRANFNSAGEVPGHASNWLITPTVALNTGDEFSFWTRSTDEPPPGFEVFPDRLEVRLSTSGDSSDVGDEWDSVGDFDTLLLSINEDLEGGDAYPVEWTEYTVTIEDVPENTDGRIAFRYFVEDSGPAGINGDYIGIDTFEYVATDRGPVESIEVTPGEAEVEVGASVDLTATAHYEDGSSADVTGSAEWASSDADIATVDTGSVTGVAEGDAMITAELDGETDTASVTVNPLIGCEAPVDIRWIDVDPASGSTEPGGSVDVTVTLGSAELTAGEYEAVLCVTSNAANADLVEVPVSLTVAEEDEPDPPEDPELDSVVVEPSEATVGVDGAVQLEATAIYEDDETVDVTDEAEWVSANTDVATVAAGLVAGVGEGVTEVTATFEGLSDSSTVTVDAEVEPGPEGLERISAEPGRVEVAIAASQHRFGDGEAGAVVLARADEYPDALAGTTLAAEHDAPLLLTSSDQLLDNVAAEIARVLGDDGQVFLAGGTAALDETVEDAAGDLGYELARLGGETRFETAGLIADELGERSQVLVTTGLDFPDALTAGAAASANDGVVLLSADEDAHDVVDDYLDGFDGEVTAVGGPATRAYPDAEAVMGATRDETAVAVAEAFFDEPVAFGVARRDDYPDALSGGAHIAAYEGPLLLTYTEDVPEETAQWLTNTDAAGGFVYGGTAAVSEDTFDELEDLTFGDNDNDDEGQ